MVYDVNVKRINSQLTYLGRCADVIERTALKSGEPVPRFALERALHLAVECMIDVGSVMIDGFVMRDPGGYLDIVDILEDEQVISSELAVKMKELVHLRERLVRYYDDLSEDEIRPYAGETGVYRAFADQVRKYLQRELGEESVE
ncbi:DUF86 domain-containing protein [Lihuaxuella thermophila]|uniref:Uncharacterized conserved protein YutE, UPF0331/DUF86 family n=1 Tax=Lihuaxuella thermophila TaxID=1173111 RepID=A0A1H8HKW1_9BACL|nr:HepT-like ribonuclease domain-containing protein [Lihuaxuella thermophila]SEN56655.1 Uncharacterized conserved protein YutE, UPF0331/DUF86 family [Lihuaxuella thermophila]